MMMMRNNIIVSLFLLGFSVYCIFDNVMASNTRLPKLIAGNWKMNPVDLKSATKLAFDVANLTKLGICKSIILNYDHNT